MKLSKNQEAALQAIKKEFGFKSVIIMGIMVDNVTLGMADGFVSLNERLGFMELETHRLKNVLTQQSSMSEPGKAVGAEVN